MLIDIVLLVTLQQPAGHTPARTPPTPTTATLEVRVGDRSVRPIDDAHVVLQGPTTREEKSDKSGTATLKTVTPGNYRVRAESEGYIALEREVTVKGAVA